MALVHCCYCGQLFDRDAVLCIDRMGAVDASTSPILLIYIGPAGGLMYLCRECYNKEEEAALQKTVAKYR